MSLRRVAVLADVHGNLPALEAVLGDVDAAGADAIVVNGDVAAGPLPRETLARLAALGDRVIWVRGNADRELVEAYDGTSTPELALTAWAAGQLDLQQRDRLAALPLTVTLDVEGLGPVLFCHATARSDTEIVLVDSSVERYRRAFAGVEEQTVVLGHTHMPFDRLVDRRRFVNAGSVGMPYGHPGASWALLGPGVELRRTEYDAEEAARVLRASGLPELEVWLEEYLFGRYSDVEALAVFTAASA
jgi:putative phosphoesterase